MCSTGFSSRNDSFLVILNDSSPKLGSQSSYLLPCIPPPHLSSSSSYTPSPPSPPLFHSSTSSFPLPAGPLGHPLNLPGPLIITVWDRSGIGQILGNFGKMLGESSDKIGPKCLNALIRHDWPQYKKPDPVLNKCDLAGLVSCCIAARWHSNGSIHLDTDFF